MFWGLSLKHLGQHADALAPLRKGIELTPDNFDLHLGMGEALLELGRRLEAETYLQNALRLNPADPRPAEALRRLKATDAE